MKDSIVSRSALNLCADVRIVAAPNSNFVSTSAQTKRAIDSPVISYRAAARWKNLRLIRSALFPSVSSIHVNLLLDHRPSFCIGYSSGDYTSANQREVN